MNAVNVGLFTFIIQHNRNKVSFFCAISQTCLFIGVRLKECKPVILNLGLLVSSICSRMGKPDGKSTSRRIEKQLAVY